MSDNFNNEALTTAYTQLSGRFNGNVGETALFIVNLLQQKQERHGMRFLLKAWQSPDARHNTVLEVLASNPVARPNGSVEHVHDAVSAAAKVLWDAETPR